MAATIAFNGSNYNFPTPFAAGFGSTLMSMLTDIGNNAVTKTGVQTLTNKTLTGPIVDSIYNGGAAQVSITPTAGATRTVFLSGSTTNPTVGTSAGNLLLSPGGTSGVTVTAVASANIGLQIYPSNAGDVMLRPDSGTNVDMRFETLGTGSVRFRPGGVETLRVLNNSAATSYITLNGGTTSSVVSIAGGTNVDLKLAPQGTGLIQFGYNVATASVPGNFSAAYVLQIKDGSGTTYYVPAKGATW
jgi:hypothetical protein